MKKELERILMGNSDFVVDGALNKNKLTELANKYDSALLKVLMKNASIKSHFFTEIESGILAFKLETFLQFINNKEFLPDSFTAYKSRIGLSTPDKKYISDNNNIVLNFPYKDCILEGGQDKEEVKREELFFNKTLAPSEINRLLDDKVFTQFKRYSNEGIINVDSLESNDNLIIKGNNLIVLHSLKKRYAGKVKLIYIDPPYNTGNDSFGYNDRFSYSTWLVFMKNRLEVAKELLREDGLIFISIDSSRQNSNGIVGTSALPYLNVLMDEVFGRVNFIGHLHWKKKKQPSFLSRIAGVMESILVYAKDENNIAKLQRGIQEDTNTRIDNASNNEVVMEIKSGIRYKGNPNTTINKGVYKNKTMTTEFLDDVTVKDGRTTNSFRAKAKYRNTQSEISRFCDEDLLFITQNNSFRRDKTEEECSKGKTITDLLLDWGQNQDATAELRKLFNITDDSKVFDTAKPELLIANILECATKEGDIVLDYHLGSGTTAAVAHKMNRQYIGIEQMDYIDDIVLVRLKKVIDGENGGISEQEGWKGGGSFVYCELKNEAQNTVKQIKQAKSLDELLIIFNKMKSSSFLSYRVDPKKLLEEDFITLSLAEQKQLLLELIDNNNLYVNYDDIDDIQYGISDEEKHINKQFYGEE
ncbi:site-specific DNA-methyltransferase [Veillonella sp.]|uniref:DNA methyltransferase n=1 Tax=Veillonella sp. TaxID=1926307 RepID=UPI0025FB6ABC|nr:site-specific DNA-methyltransferase [Veillonella sp.]